MTISQIFETEAQNVDVMEIKCNDYRRVLPVSPAYFKGQYMGTDVWRAQSKAYSTEPYMNGETLLTIYL